MSHSATEGARAPGTLPATAGMVALVFVWGSYFPVVGVLLVDWDPLMMSASRTALAALTLVGILLAVEGWSTFARPTPWGRVALLGLIGICFNVIAFAVAIDRSGAVVTSLISGAGPALAALMGHVFYRERLKPWGWAMVGVTVAGAVLVVVGGDTTDYTFRGGEVLVALGYAAWYWFAAQSQRWLPTSSQIRISALTMLLGSVMIAATSAVAFALGWVQPRASAEPLSLALIAYSGAVSVGLGLVLWNVGVKRLGLAVASFYSNMAPVVAVGLGVALGGSITWVQVAGGALVVAAVIGIQTRGVARTGL